ncbi:hypothetical protein AMS68_006130 [Peltaster fructicola]|uniref:NAD-dependent epimerase/dehydratase domain-containing protein n=1 Tax=Peltaster fructicola TaxID=286661 RepID=A0A6H0Y0S7_9PEZI|nr:hypothetical protein AMS68_006130 [Peltaster fructicola]
MSGQFVLITGSTGHVGFATLVKALSNGYKVRAAVRSDAKAQLVKSAKSVQPYSSQLEFVIVKDITRAGAFDEAVKGVDGIVHVASPIPNHDTKDFEAQVVTPAVEGTTQILYSAKKEMSIKRVVVTSALAAVVQFPPLDEPFTADQLGHVQDEIPDAISAYLQSKVRANRAVRQFIKDEKPHFNIHSVMPTFVVGANELATTVQEIDAGSNAFFLGPILGKKNEQGTLTGVCHLDDVAAVHIAALDPKLRGNLNFGVNYDYKQGFKWDDTIDIARKEFPDAVKAGILPLGGHCGDVFLKFDTSETERILSIKFKTPSEMGRNILQQYVQAAQAEQKA